MVVVRFDPKAGVRLGILGPLDRHPTDPGPRHDELAASQIASHVRFLGIDVEDLAVEVDGAGGRAVVRGRTETRDDRERVVAAVGNVEGIGVVEDHLVSDVDGPACGWHLVREGETLAEIARRHYGVVRLFEAIFEANRPVLEHPDRLRPGQGLRIPVLSPPRHVVRPGETLEDVARHWYGGAEAAATLAAANPDGVRDGRVAVGVELVVPLAGE